MSPQQQAELIGGAVARQRMVDRMVASPPHGLVPDFETEQTYVRVVGSWSIEVRDV